VTSGLRRSLLAAEGFEADFEHFAIYGTCAECADRKGNGPPSRG
jgi:Fe2+ or Zn2+ uptake regulation protein